jgi:hypothetical protein
VGPLVIVLAVAALFVARRRRIVLLLWAATLWSISLSWGGATRLTGSEAPLSWHAPAWFISGWVPILKNIGWIRISILTDLLLALLVAITLESVATAIQAHGRAWRRYLADVTVVGAGVLMAVPLLIGSMVPYAGFQTVAVPEVLRHIPTGSNGSASTVLVLPSSSPFSGTPMAWQAVAGFPYRDFEGYSWHPQPGKRTAVAGSTSSVLDYIVTNSAEASPSVVVSAALRGEISAAFARYGVRFAVVVDGYPGSEQLTRVYNQIFGTSRRFGAGRLWSTCRTGPADPRIPACTR